VGGDGPFPRVPAGARVTLWTTLRAPRGFTNPGAFDARAHARREGVQAHGWCKSVRLLRLEPPARPGWRWHASTARAVLRARLERHVPAGTERALVLAMVLGERGALDGDTDEAFRAAGTYHVLAISGAQVALIAGLLWLPARRLGLPAPLAALGVSAAVTAYAAFVGGDVPVVRAALMMVVLARGRALELDADLVNLLGLAALLLLAVRPAATLDVGFQLSFGATWAVLALTPRLVRGVRPWPLRIELGLASSLAAQAGLLPLLATHFHRLAPAALLLNLAAVPLSSAVLLVGFGVPLAGALGDTAGDRAGDLAWICAHALRRSADLVATLPALDVRVPTPSAVAVLAYAGGVLGLLRGARRGRATLLLACGLIGLWRGPGAHPADGRLHLTALDVGQGEALVVTSPQGATLLVDAGGLAGRRFDVGAAVVAPYLWAQGVRHVDALALSHAHPDHVGGAPFVLRAFHVGQTWEGPAARPDPGWRALDAELRAAGVTRRALAAGDRWRWDEVEIDVVAPPPPASPPWRVRNDDSLVLRLRFGAVVFLLSGDIEAEGERRLRLRADVLKVPHHGSRTSSSEAFLAELRPRLALVSAGVGNVYGHPHPEVVARYRRVGVILLRTDREGAVSIASDGRSLWTRSAADPTERRRP
jgi:competence protein ComEC